MKLVDHFIDRPLPIFLLAGVAVFLGVWCAFDLPVNRAPEVEIPYTLVVVPYIGASAEDVESEITIELEEESSTPSTTFAMRPRSRARVSRRTSSSSKTAPT